MAGFFPVTIAAGQSISDAVDISAAQVRAIIMPPQWNNAMISFQLSIDGTNFFDLSHIKSTDIVLLHWGPSHWVPMPIEDFPKGVWIKIRSGHPFAPAVQDADRLFMLVNDAVVAEEPTRLAEIDE